MPQNEKYKNIQKLEKEIKIPNRYIPLTQTIIRSPYPEKEIYLMRKLKQTEKITSNIRQEIENIDNDFTEKVRNKIKPEIEKVSCDIIKMNRIIQRRYIKERLEKNNEEKKEGKEGDLVYKSEVSDLNNIPQNINDVLKSNSSRMQENNADNKKESENTEKNKEENTKGNKGNRYMNL